MSILPKFDFSMLDEATAEALRFAGSTPYADERIDLRVAPNFLSAEECAIFVQMIDADCSPSRLAYAGLDADFRTSETCYFRSTLPIVELLELRLSLFLSEPMSHGERIQGQRYLEGQQFKSHTDYFHDNRPDYEEHCGVSGNRTWTAMIYLNEPEEGGETYFHHLKHGFTPRTGTMLVWGNLCANGRGNPMTMHHGMPVTKGAKYVLTKWYRQRPCPQLQQV